MHHVGLTSRSGHYYCSCSPPPPHPAQTSRLSPAACRYASSLLLGAQSSVRRRPFCSMRGQGPPREHSKPSLRPSFTNWAATTRFSMEIRLPDVVDAFVAHSLFLFPSAMKPQRLGAGGGGGADRLRDHPVSRRGADVFAPRPHRQFSSPSPSPSPYCRRRSASMAG